MAVEGSILNKESIKKIMIEQYGISVEAIKKINRGSANVFEVFSKDSHYILKEFQSKIDIDKIKIEYTVVEHLRRDGVATPKYILNKNGFVTYIIITPNIPKGINVSKHIRPLILNFLLL